MQRMIIMGLNRIQIKGAKVLYSILPSTKVYIKNNNLIVETEISGEDKKEIAKQYNKTGNIVLFEDI